MPWHIQILLLLYPFVLAAYLYVGWRLVKIQKQIWQTPAKKALWRVLAPGLVLNLFPLFIIFWFFGSKSPLFVVSARLHWQDFLLLFPFWWGLITVMEALPYFLLLDFFVLLAGYFGIEKNRMNRWRGGIEIVLLAALFLFVAFRAYSDTFRIRNHQYSLQINGIPPELDNISLTLISDIQVDRYTQKKKIEQLNRLVRQDRPDILFSAGDLVTHGRDFIPQGLNILCRFNATTARVACMGDHDYWSGPRQVASGLKKCGWNFLQDVHQIISYHGKRILVTGITEIYNRHISAEQLERLLASAPPADLKILLVHQPGAKLIRAAEKHGYDLFLAGHTHGGQVVFHPFGYHLTISRFEDPYYSGYYRHGKLQIIVTNGVGLSIVPLRYGAPAEISQIWIHPGKSKSQKIPKPSAAARKKSGRMPALARVHLSTLKKIFDFLFTNVYRRHSWKISFI